VPADRRLFARSRGPSAGGPRHSPARSDDRTDELLLKHHADADHGALIGKVTRRKRPCRLPEPMRRPPTLTVPASQPSRWLIHRNSVLLPDPLGPSSATTSPTRTVMSDAGENGLAVVRLV